MSYYESANGVQITRERVIQELSSHGLPDTEQDLFFAECGNLPQYPAQKVLSWLGY